MIVTELEEMPGGKRKVYLDGQFAFVLYRGELSRCQVEVGADISEEQYRCIVEEILWLRIRKRCLFLLKDMDRSEAQIHRKLNGDLYPQELIERAVQWLKEHRYLDDYRFAESYVRCRKEKKSKSQLKMELMKKGVSAQAIEAAFEEEELPDEESLIRAFLRKKGVSLAELDYKEKQKLYGSLRRKGFSGSSVSRILCGVEEFD